MPWTIDVTMKARQHNSVRQQGAALVIGLILLLVLTLLAVSGMNSASLEFVMAGNEQYHTNAFQAAEAGIEQSVAQEQAAAQPWNPNPLLPANAYAGATTATDSWTANVALQNNGVGNPAPSGYSLGTFTQYYFEVQSAGTSTRGANAAHVQGISKLAPK